jgi:hypothetical protein
MSTPRLLIGLLSPALCLVVVAVVVVVLLLLLLLLLVVVVSGRVARRALEMLGRNHRR